MLSFLSNMLPRLRQFSQSLDQTELFVDKPWVLLDEEGKQQTYIFRRSGELLMSLDGVVQTGKWEYIAPAESILIDRKVDKLLLNHFFFTEALLVLARDGRPESSFVLANRLLIPDMNIESYLRSLEAKPEILPEPAVIPIAKSEPIITSPQLPRKYLTTASGTQIEVIGSQEQLSISAAVYHNNQPADDGKYVMNDESGSHYGIVVEKGKIMSLFWPKEFKLTTGESIIVDCDATDGHPFYRNRIFTSNGTPLENGNYSIVGISKVRVRNGLINGFPIF